MKNLSLGGIIFILMLSMSAEAQLSSVFQAEHEKNEGVLLVWDYAPSRDSVLATATASTKHPLSAPNGNHTFWFDPSTDIREADSDEFNVYPNPAKASFFIQNAENKEYRIELLTLDGRLVMSTQIFGNQLIRKRPGIKQGIYILNRISDSGERKSVKLILK